jgi:hypothetical protein
VEAYTGARAPSVPTHFATQAQPRLLTAPPAEEQRPLGKTGTPGGREGHCVRQSVGQWVATCCARLHGRERRIARLWRVRLCLPTTPAQATSHARDRTRPSPPPPPGSRQHLLSPSAERRGAACGRCMGGGEVRAHRVLRVPQASFCSRPDLNIVSTGSSGEAAGSSISAQPD